VIRPLPEKDRVVLEISLRFRGSADGETTLNLPQDRYGAPDVHESVISVRGSAEVTVEAGEVAAQWIVRHAPAAMVDVVYTISWAPERSSGYAYSPDVGPEHFHFMGPQWIAWPEGYEGEVDLEVAFVSIPDEWIVLSSFGLDAGPHRMRDVMLDDLASFIAGGAYRVLDFACRGKPVRVGITGTFEVSDDTVFANTERIVCAERRWMDDHEQPFYTVSVTPRDGIRAGTAVSNAFVALVDPEISERRLNILLAHEMFHYWLLGRARVVGADFDDEVWASKWGYQWVDEGFTEYFARKILHEVGLLSREELVGLTNQDIEDYWKNPHRHIPYSQLRRAAEEERFMSTHQRIGYFRGSLIALDWDTKIQEATGGRQSLSNAIREVVETAVKRGGQLPEAEFHRIMSQRGIDSAVMFQRVILEGEPPPVNALAFAPEYTLDERTIHELAPGFDVIESWLDKTVRGVVPGGHADEAGLRNGMELVDLDNSRQYDPEAPMRVTVRLDGAERAFELFPKGPARQIPTFRRVASPGESAEPRSERSTSSG
jgi:predicted metalloprotease with PDZ domain